MTEVFSLTEAREQLAELADRVRSAGDRIVLQGQGKAVAALVPPSDLRALEALEDRLDGLDALAALADYRANGGVEFERLNSPWIK